MLECFSGGGVGVGVGATRLPLVFDYHEPWNFHARIMRQQQVEVRVTIVVQHCMTTTHVECRGNQVLG